MHLPPRSRLPPRQQQAASGCGQEIPRWRLPARSSSRMCDQQEAGTTVVMGPPILSLPYRLAHGTKTEALPFWMIVLSMAAGCVPAGLVFTSGENVTRTSYQEPRPPYHACHRASTVLLLAVSVLALPAQVKAMEPSAAAAINSAAVVIAAVVHLSGVGWGSAADYFGRRPVALIGCAIIVVATAIQVGAVYRSGILGLGLFLFGYILSQLGLTMVGVIWAALVSDFGVLYPARKGVISALFYLFFNLGAILGVGAAGAVLPVTPVCHGFWWFLLAVAIVWLLAVALVPRVTYEVKGNPLDESAQHGAQARAETAALRASLSLPAAAGLRHGLRSSKSGSLRKTWPTRSSFVDAEGWDATPTLGGEAPDANPAASLTPRAEGRGPMLSMLCALMLGGEYRAFRAVTMARTLYYAAVGVFQASALVPPQLEPRD